MGVCTASERWLPAGGGGGGGVNRCIYTPGDVSTGRVPCHDPVGPVSSGVISVSPRVPPLSERPKPIDLALIANFCGVTQ